MQIFVVRCLRDNFAYLLADGGEAAVIDPGEAAPVRAALAARGLRLTAVWATHHHADHVGGVRELADDFPDLTVVAHRIDLPRAAVAFAGARVRPVAVEEGDVVELGAVRARILHNPGHTLGAISYVVERDGVASAVFTGDTLFGAGCGRLFEGDAATMHRSLERLAALPSACLVYFGHEYTRSNLRFAEAASPGEAAVAERTRAVEARLAEGADTTPSTIALERATNPFLRCAEPALAETVRARGGAGVSEAMSPVHVFAQLRAWKDSF